ncbi:MAG: T9SS type A sorting domain-containing protein [Bacteroidia bacterium]|nr:T9SS type A sorting domain-containing protein [Bacteroidia bacterium]
MKQITFPCLLLLLLSLFPVAIRAQAIQNAVIFPASHTVGDSVFLDVEAMLTSSDCWVEGKSLTITANQVNLIACYNSGLLTAICNRRDTFFLGNSFSAGNYNLRFIARAGFDPGDSLCTQSGSAFDTIDLAFTVDVANSLSHDLKTPRFQIFPSMITGNAFLKSNGSTGGKIQLEWRNLNGQLVKKMSLNSLQGQKSIPLELANLKPGIYLVNILPEGKPGLVQKIVIMGER